MVSSTFVPFEIAPPRGIVQAISKRTIDVRAHPLLPLVVAALAGNVSAQVTAPSGSTTVETGPGWGVATTTTMTTARILAFDPAARRVDVEFPDGRQQGLLLGPQVRRLGQLKEGDIVSVAFTDALMLSLRKQGSGVVSRSEGRDVRRTPSNAAPGGVAQAETTVVADVVAVDAGAGVITLRGPQRTMNLRIKDPKQLALVRPGDQVEATYSEAVAVSIEPAR